MYRGNIGIVEKKMETTIKGLGFIGFRVPLLTGYTLGRY